VYEILKCETHGHHYSTQYGCPHCPTQTTIERNFIIEMLTALGQMMPPFDKNSASGIYIMKSSVRSALIAKGWWDILEGKNK
jgi:hypothetical protein